MVMINGTIRIAGIVSESIVDGPGIRLTVFTQGCPHNCPGCQNPDTHSFEGGYIESISEIKKMLQSNPMLDGLTLSGGEPFCQPEGCKELADFANWLGLNVWAYTGFIFEEIVQDPEKKKLLQSIDVLVDGKFIEAQKDEDLIFRGSSNQRIIRVPMSLAEGRIVLSNRYHN